MIDLMRQISPFLVVKWAQRYFPFLLSCAPRSNRHVARGGRRAVEAPARGPAQVGTGEGHAGAHQAAGRAEAAQMLL